MSNPENDPDIILREHTFDGIKEFDQKLPNWWLFTLYIAIVAFVVYWVAYYQLPLGMRSDTEKVEAQMALIQKKRDEQMKEMMATISDESLLELSKDPAQISAGQAIYETKCVACHSPTLKGKSEAPQYIGVNLIDAEWLHGQKPLEVMNIVTNGAPDPTKGMIAWSSLLSPTEIAQVTAYVLSKQPSAQ